MLFVTFHKSNGNVHAYKHGELIEKKVLDQKGDQLRGIYLVPGKPNYLYVADGSSDSSNVYLYQGADTSYELVKVLISSKDAPAILHPFALAFDNMGRCYVSSQNTNVVTTLYANDAANFVVGPVAPYLTEIYPTGTYLPGTLVASSKANLPNAPQTNGLQEVPETQGGLGIEIGPDDTNEVKVLHSVRDVLAYKLSYMGEQYPLVFVADEAGGLVRAYDALGYHLMDSNPLDSPVHLLIAGETIYVGAGDEVLTSPIPNPIDKNPQPWVFTPLDLSSAAPDGKVAGMTFDDKGNFFVAVRTTNKIMKYEPDFKHGTTWASDTPNGPEFLLHVRD